MLMLLLFLGGGLGVSGADVVLFHLNNQEEIPLLHVEAAGADCHAEACLVGFVVDGGRFLSTSSQGTIARAAVETDVVLLYRADPASPVRRISSLPRSPPLHTR